ncbi:MAG: YbdK family carboxylate-amine ligase [Gemmatimonadota bacterium]|nr:YbdK family carboxylate-amine ligase [Gemmatimonadota bacterium]
MTLSQPDSYTLGVEEEYQLVDGATGALRSRARAVIAGDWTGEIKPEMQENTVEVETEVCTSAAEAGRELARLRLQTATAAEASGARIVAAGTHPFSHWSGQRFTDQPVYQTLRAEYRRLAESQNIFGMHIHVGLPPGVDAVPLMNVARLALPALLALSASSPFFLGEDTGYASYRSILWRRWPRAGAPPRFGSQGEFEALVRTLIETGQIDAPGRIYWDLRPHHRFPTLEFRVADVTPRVEDAVLVAALARSVVAAAAEGVLREPSLPDSHLHSLLGEGAWRASRDALDARWVDLLDGEPRVRSARDTLLRLAERLQPVAERLGDGEVLATLPAALGRGGAARRTRERNQTVGGDMAETVMWLAEETVQGTGLDRRREQRLEGAA